MSNEFGGLAAQVEDTFQVELIDPVTEDVIRDANGKGAYVEVESFDSKAGLEFDAERRKGHVRKMSRGKSVDSDPIDDQIAKTARLTRSWYLVDPATKQPIELPCTEQNALKLYTAGPTRWIYRLVSVGANDTANFIRRPSKISGGSPSTSSGGAAS